MKTKRPWIIAVSVLLANGVHGQFVYDQQSSDESNLGGGASDIQSGQPMGQSFIPALSSVGFVRLYLSDSALNSMSVTFRLDLRSDSITGPIIGSSDLVTLSDGFIGAVNFFFSTPPSVTPGTSYYFRPEVISGGPFSVYAYNSFGYSRGAAYYNGVAVPGYDLWFREGVVVPEPSSGAILLLGLCGLVARRRWSS